MKQKFNKTPLCSESHIHSQVGSLRDTIQYVREQIEIDCFDKTDLPQAEEIALVIAEVMALPPKCLVQINGDKLPAEFVGEIYSRLTNEHVDMVIENFRNVKYAIKHIKTYLRTALYNAVFECEAKSTNEFLKDDE